MYIRDDLLNKIKKVFNIKKFKGVWVINFTNFGSSYVMFCYK